jgi:hypothetical protein
MTRSANGIAIPDCDPQLQRKGKRNQRQHSDCNSDLAESRLSTRLGRIRQRSTTAPPRTPIKKTTSAKVPRIAASSYKSPWSGRAISSLRNSGISSSVNHGTRWTARLEMVPINRMTIGMANNTNSQRNGAGECCLSPIAKAIAKYRRLMQAQRAEAATCSNADL